MKLFLVARSSASIETTTIESEIAETIAEVSVPAKVIVYDDPNFPYDAAVFAIQKGTKCSLEKAEYHANRITKYGKDCVMEDTIEKCLEASNIMRNLGLITEVLI